MEVRDLKFITAACDGALLRGRDEAPVRQICTDSRRARPGDVFFALPGERFDGHNFLHQAVAGGVAAVVIERRRIPPVLPGCAVIAVEDTRKALGCLAAAYRRQFALPIVAVGGSNGKTTTKELIASVLRRKFATLWNEASFNNDIGVPLTLLRLESQHEAAVLEAGTNHPGELAPLLEMIQPRYGVLTNLAREHLEFFGDIAGVVEEEGALGELLPADGKLFVNGDSEWAPRVIQRSRATAIRLGLADTNDYRVRRLRPDKQGVTFQIEAPDTGYAGEYRVNLLGRHQAVNALFAVAVGVELRLSRADIERGLAECRPAGMRLELWEGNGLRVLNDAYNANADSVLAALRTLLDLPCKGRRIAVLGDMAELGAHTEAAHEEVGRATAEMGVGQLFAVGKMAAATARGARAAGLNRVLEFDDVEGAVSAVKGFLKSGDLVLLKASRAVRLERIADALKTEKP